MMPSKERIAFLGPQLAVVDDAGKGADLATAFRDAIIRQRQSLKPFEVRFKSGQHFLRPLRGGVILS